MKAVKFTSFGANSVVGGFGPGDVARVSDEFAAHLVDEAKVAKYADDQPQAPAPPQAAAKATASPRKSAKAAG